MTGPLDWDGLLLKPIQKTFGEPVLFCPLNGDSFIISGVFDAGYHASQVIEGSFGAAPLHVTNNNPILGCRASAFKTTPVQGDRVQIRGVYYAIQEVQPDSHGGLHIALNEGDTPEEVF